MIDHPEMAASFHETGGSMFLRFGHAQYGNGWMLVAPNGEFLLIPEHRQDELEREYQESRARTDTAP